MGIPYYFREITNQFPETVRSERTRDEIHRMYFDANGIIHQAAGKALNELSLEVLQTITTDALFDHVIAESIELFQRCVLSVRPTKLVYLAIDGVPPRSKMMQQRNRRYLSEWETSYVMKETSDKHPSVQRWKAIQKKWSSAYITPGTKFMRRLDAALRTFANSAFFSNLGVVCEYSSHLVPEEGEHKIMQQLTFLRENETVVIYGLDADLIMLSLIQKVRIFLMREPQAYQMPDTSNYLYLDVDTLRTHLLENLKEQYRMILTIDEYVALCFLLGNDFIPSLLCLRLARKGHSTLMQVCSEVQHFMGEQKLLTSDFELNPAFWKELFQLLQRREPELYAKHENEWFTQTYKNWTKDPLREKQLKAACYPQWRPKKESDCIEPEREGWNMRYNYYILDNCQESASDEYLRGLQWCVHYYFQKRYDPSFFYPYPYPPLTQTLFQTLFQSTQWLHGEVETQSLLEEGRTSTEQDLITLLCCVVPPRVLSAVLPDEARSVFALVTDSSGGCCAFFPVSFDVRSYLRTFLYECSPRIMLLNYDKIRAAVCAKLT